MQLYAGTSGYSYKEWKGPFYPEKLPASQMLSHYASELPAVEINNTFYRMPKASVMAKWVEQVPEGFVFVIKASQRITHHRRLKEAEEPTQYLWETVQELGPHLGPVLFQLPPNFRKDVERLKNFLAGLPDGMRPALEFRHESWDDDEVHAALRDANAALCAADVDDAEVREIVPTADWGYLRLRRPGYDDAEIAAWVERIGSQDWRDAFVFFKHEDEGAAPRMAHRMNAAFAES